MKRINLILAIILFLMAGCSGNRQSYDGLITIDVTKSYPMKELFLQDFMDIEYVSLETNDEFLTQGMVKDVGKEIIIVTNQINDGDIFIYDRNGKGIRKINRRGQGGEEYVYLHGIMLDEDNGEIFVNDNSRKRIIVYDFYGKFKRNILHKEDARYTSMFNFDKDFFIWWNSSFQFLGDAASVPSHFISSKQDGSILKEIEIPFKQRKSTVLISHNSETNMTASWSIFFSSIIPYDGSWILTEPSSDTIFRFSNDFIITPLMIRTPSIQSMDPETFLFPVILTDQYYFLQVSKKEYDFSTRQSSPNIGLMYDRQEQAIFEYIVYNDDYSTKRKVNMERPNVNDEIAFWQIIEAHQLVEAYEKGELKGKLKEIAAELGAEDNPVIMLVKHRK